MKTHRHPHPHIDPRQPRHATRPGTNPPVFAWKPDPDEPPFQLRIARDPDLKDVVLEVSDLADPIFLPEQAFEVGTYFWTWSTGDQVSEVFQFEITPAAVTLEVPSVDGWLDRLPDEHPRIWVRPEQLEALRAQCEADPNGDWSELIARAEQLLSKPHELAEPDYLPDWNLDYATTFKIWSRIMWSARTFMEESQILGLAYLATNDTRFARAACQRLASIAKWDPEGSSYIEHNDEAHMALIWWGPIAADWVWDQFTDEERAAVIDQFRRRGEINFKHMHDQGCYGVTRFGSHSGREIVFLAMIGLVFHEQIPDARRWLDWLRAVLCGIWPVWAGDDGAWAEGPSYGNAYVTIMTQFALALKRGTGIDLFRRPFWANHARWLRDCVPYYAEWIGFGDHTERWGSTWNAFADLVDLIACETGTRGEFDHYINSLRAIASETYTPPHRTTEGHLVQWYLRQADEPMVTQGRPSSSTHRLFPTAGWAAVRTDLQDADRDVAMIFRSSPMGSWSHSHANHNDFIIHVGGRVMAMPSGYYDGYASKHHAHWVWHTKSHNCLTLSDAGQTMRSYEAIGAIEQDHEDGHLVFFRGNADQVYPGRARRCRRHVAYLKKTGCFFMLDEFIAEPTTGVWSIQWNIHSWAKFQVDEAERRFQLERDGRTLTGHFLYHPNAFFSLTEGWDPMPVPPRDEWPEQWLPQHHLRFTPTAYLPKCNLGVVFTPGLPGETTPTVTTRYVDGVEVAEIGDDWIAVNQGKGIRYAGHDSKALALLMVDGQLYELNDEGASVVASVTT